MSTPEERTVKTTDFAIVRRFLHRHTAVHPQGRLEETLHVDAQRQYMSFYACHDPACSARLCLIYNRGRGAFASATLEASAAMEAAAKAERAGAGEGIAHASS